MPAIKHYVVTETRVVKVTANSMADAVRIAACAFEHGQNADVGVRAEYAREELDGVWGNTSSLIRSTEMHIREGLS